MAGGDRGVADARAPHCVESTLAPSPTPDPTLSPTPTPHRPPPPGAQPTPAARRAPRPAPDSDREPAASARPSLTAAASGPRTRARHAPSPRRPRHDQHRPGSPIAHPVGHPWTPLGRRSRRSLSRCHVPAGRTQCPRRGAGRVGAVVDSSIPLGMASSSSCPVGPGCRGGPPPSSRCRPRGPSRPDHRGRSDDHAIRSSGAAAPSVVVHGGPAADQRSSWRHIRAAGIGLDGVLLPGRPSSTGCNGQGRTATGRDGGSSPRGPCNGQDRRRRYRAECPPVTVLGPTGRAGPDIGRCRVQNDAGANVILTWFSATDRRPPFRPRSITSARRGRRRGDRQRRACVPTYPGTVIGVA